MTEYRVYVGVMIDPNRTWEELGDQWHQNVREIQDVSVGLDALLRVRKLIDDGTLEGRQVDWGAWTADVSKQQLLELYPRKREPIDVGAWRPFMEGQTDARIIETMNFDPGRKLERLTDRRYELVAIEEV